MEPILHNKIDSLALTPPYVLIKNCQGVKSIQHGNDKQNDGNILPSVVMKLLEARKQGAVRISFGRWNQLNMGIHLKKIAQINCLIFQLTVQNNEPKILKQLSNIKFYKLRTLDLGANNITSLESLVSTFVPQLQQLKLQENKICEIRTFRKLTLGAQNLFSICLTNNPIKQYEGLEEISSKVLSLLVLGQFYKNERYCDIVSIAKLQSNLIKNINLRTVYRIDKDIVLRTLLKKWIDSSMIIPKRGRLRFQENA